MYNKNMDFYGDYHTHTKASDGLTTPEDNVIAGINRGLKEIAITDHGFANPDIYSLTRKKFYYQRKKIESLRKAYDGRINILHGVEADITGLDGTIDLTSDEIKDLDVLLLGYHTFARPNTFYDFKKLFFNAYFRFIKYPSKRAIRRNTGALISAIIRYPVDILVHLNHLLKVDCYEIAKAASDYGTYIELNAKHLYTLSHDVFEKMLTTDVKFIANTDAHTADAIGDFSAVTEYLKFHDIDMNRIVNYGQKPIFKCKI